MPIGFVRFIVLSSFLATAVSCSLSKKYEESRPANVLELEARLERAGFTRVPIETPEQNGAVAQLPMHQLNRYESAKGNVFWYADPTVCSCLYQGDQAEYQRYLGELEQDQQQQKETAEYVNEVRPDQALYMSPFGYAFPPPLIYGGWPVLVPSRPPPVIRPGGGGVGPHPQPGGGGGNGGGGVHSRGGGGRGVHGRH